MRRSLLLVSMLLMYAIGHTQLIPQSSDFPIFNQDAANGAGSSFGVDNSTWHNEQNNVERRFYTPWDESEYINGNQQPIQEIDTATIQPIEDSLNSVNYAASFDPGGPFDPPLDTPIDDGLLFLLAVGLSLGLRLITPSNKSFPVISINRRKKVAKITYSFRNNFSAYTHSATSQLQAIPQHVKLFLLKVLFIFIVWKCCYHSILAPQRIIDAPLTETTANIAASSLQSIFSNQIFTVGTDATGGKSILMNGQKCIGIADACNALELFVLYLGFLFCIKATTKSRLKFIFGGILTIFLLNIVRMTGIATLYIQHVHYPFIDFAHKYLFKIVVYAFIYLLWKVYAAKNKHLNSITA